MPEGKEGKGRWSAAEESRYLKGLELYGANFAVLEAFVQTRSIDQIRGHHRAHLRKLRREGVVIAAALTPKQGRKPKKRKSETSDIIDSKKPKQSKDAPTSKEAPMKETVESKAAVKPPGSTISVPELQDSDQEPEVEKSDLKPPRAIPSSSSSSNSEASKPTLLDPVIKEYSEKYPEENDPVLPTMKEWLVSCYEREEVQTILAGIFGFVAVVVFKKLLA